MLVLSSPYQMLPLQQTVVSPWGEGAGLRGTVRHAYAVAVMVDVVPNVFVGGIHAAPLKVGVLNPAHQIYSVP